MATLRELAGSIELQLHQVLDDADINFNQILFWCSFFVNKYRYQKLNYIDSGSYLMVFTNVPVTTFSSNVNPNRVVHRKYFSLPANIYDLHKDRGINYVSYDQLDDACLPAWAGVTFYRTTPLEAKRLYYNEYERPRPDHPYFYRVGGYVYLLGLECVNITSLEVGLFVPFNPISDCNIDEEIGMPEMEDYITKNVLDLGRFAILMPSNTSNLGTSPDDSGQVPLKGINTQAASADQLAAMQQAQAQSMSAPEGSV